MRALEKDPGKCFKCGSSLTPGPVERGSGVTLSVREGKYGWKATGNSSKIEHVAWRCPSCRKVRAVTGNGG